MSETSSREMTTEININTFRAAVNKAQAANDYIRGLLGQFPKNKIKLLRKVARWATPVIEEMEYQSEYLKVLEARKKRQLLTNAKLENLSISTTNPAILEGESPGPLKGPPPSVLP